MRETRLERGGARRVLRTDDAGTAVLDGASGTVAEEHGTDRHDELLERHERDGWRVAAEGDVAPPGATGRPPGSVAGDAGEAGPEATASDGEAG